MGWVDHFRGREPAYLAAIVATLLGAIAGTVAPTLGDAMVVIGAIVVIAISISSAVRRVPIRFVEFAAGAIVVATLNVTDPFSDLHAALSAAFGLLLLVGITLHSKFWLPPTPTAFRNLVGFNIFNSVLAWFSVWAIAAQADAYDTTFATFAHITAVAALLTAGVMIVYQPPFRAFGTLLSMTLFAAASILDSTLVLADQTPPDTFISVIRVLGFGAVIAPIMRDDYGVPAQPAPPSLYRTVFITLVAMLVPVSIAVVVLSSDDPSLPGPIAAAAIVVLLVCAGRLIVVTRTTVDRFEIDLEKAAVDPLTGLANRLWLQQRLQRKHRELSSRTLLVVLLGDMPSVNRIAGYRPGEKLLVECAIRLGDLPELTGADVARIGDDQFGIVINDPTERIIPIADKIIEELGEPVITEAGAVRSSVSIGITASAAPESIDGGTVIHWAERAARIAADRGGDRLEVYSLGMSPSHRRQLGLDPLEQPPSTRRRRRQS